jgi:DNA-binding FadR family transcriptional regulator
MRSDAEQTTTLARDLADRVLRRIQQSDLGEGAFFMTESDLAQEYAVSRTVAREAVGRLKALGILEGRKRKGLVVRRPDPLRLLECSLPSMLASQEDIAELAMLRRVLELGAIDLAVQNATDEQIERLGELASEFEQAVRRRAVDSVRELDIAFHALILQMTGSKLVAGMQAILLQFFETAYGRTAYDQADAERMIWEHEETASAIRDRDANRARTMLQLQSRGWSLQRARRGLA